MYLYKTIFCLLVLLALGCKTSTQQPPLEETFSDASTPFVWENANIYFLLTDRFNNGDPANDLAFERQPDGAPLRYFMGGDLKGITQKIQEGYFSDLGITAIWMTPFVEQIHSYTDEGTGKTYGFHGYWARDWTSVDPNFGTEADLAEMITTAHEHGIRILMDAVLNHTGPVTPVDTQWPRTWVRTSPKCDFKNYRGTISCTLVENLPDIRTESDEAVVLPAFLTEKWKAEGRLEQELKELDDFFARTAYPRAARFYLIKWLTDWVAKYGIDGFRVDTAKHTEESVWTELKKEASLAFNAWKKQHPEAKLDEQDFFMTGEVYGYGIHSGRLYDFGDQQVDFFDHGFQSLINFAFKYDAQKSPEKIFSSYSDRLNSSEWKGLSVLNYLSSHDDAEPFDKERTKTFETGTKLLLSPGAAQVYYGDETARPLNIAEAQGDAKLRSFMNWEDAQSSELLTHWQKLGQFRRDHISVGAGVHEQLQKSPYIFKRSYDKNGLRDRVLVAMNLPQDESSKTIKVFGVFPEGTKVRDYYSGQTSTVTDGKLRFDTKASMLLVGEI